MPSSPPRVTIGLPVYNGERYLQQTLDSIQSQDLADWELVIADNASTDATEQICRERAASDGRIRYIRNSVNLGAPANYNLVCRLATAPLFKWASSNDLLGPGLLSKCVRELDKDAATVLAYPTTYTFDQDVSTAEQYPESMDLTAKSPYCRFQSFLSSVRLNNVMNGVIRTSALQRTPLHRVFYSSDICLIAELALRGSFVEVPDAIFYRRLSTDANVKTDDIERALAHWRPNSRRPPPFQNWRFILSLFGAIARVHPGITDTYRAMVYTAQVAYWRKRELAYDLLGVLRTG